MPGRFGSRLVGSVRRPLHWSVLGPSSIHLFFSVAFSRFAQSGLGGLVLVLAFFLPLFRSQSGVPIIQHVACRFIGIFFSTSSSFHRPCCGRVCVCVCVCVRMYVCVRTIWLDIKPRISAGACGTHVLATCNEAVGMSGKGNREGANIVYRCCFKLSISPVI